MSKVVFRAERGYYAVPYEHLFKCGTDILALANLFRSDGGRIIFDKKHFFGSEEEWERLQALPDWKNAGRSYIFASGKGHNELVLEDPVVIEAMRAYAKTTNNIIVELDEDGTFPAAPEGTPFIARMSYKVLTPAMYMDRTPAEGKTFIFNMGEERNKYITTDADEIRTIRRYVRSHANCGISDPTYKAPFSED